MTEGRFKEVKRVTKPGYTKGVYYTEVTGKCDKCGEEFPFILKAWQEGREYVPAWYENWEEGMPCFECHPDDPEEVERAGQELRELIEWGERSGKLKRPVWS